MRIYTLPAGHAETVARTLKVIRDGAETLAPDHWLHDGSPSTVWFCVEASDRLPEVVREITKALRVSSEKGFSADDTIRGSDVPTTRAALPSSPSDSVAA